MTETTKVNFKSTLNLPKTGFPMRANLAQNEPQSQKRWDKETLYERILESRSDAKPFVFHDGPPYANGSIHAGHLLNKVLKDFVVRTRTLMGMKCEFIPGWDCHGLPIEHRVMSDLVESGKVEKLNSLSEDNRRMAVRRECARYAHKHHKHQEKQMKRLLTLADYEHPYLTLDPQYEQAVLEVFADLVEQGIVYRDLKPVHWSIANQTALAEAELEYYDREDPSIYVDFEAADTSAVARAFSVELDRTPSFMIWTTTPWTLPANLAIAVNEGYRYSLVRVDGNVTIIATELVEKVTQAANSEGVEELAQTDGASLVGLRYVHPFVDVLGQGQGVADILRRHHGSMLQNASDMRKVFSIVAAEYVTLEDGTGLVHTAPGHGADDYHTGLREELPIYCPVRDDGTYDDSVPEWLRGLSVWDANEKVMMHLRESGHLFHDFMFTHSYPHDWRSKTPVIFRATEQWFIGVDHPMKNGGRTLRDMALKTAESDIRFIPEWGRNRLRGMLENRPDWCLSRQRAWGLPIPAFEAPTGVLLTAASVRAVAKLIGEKGSDAWFTDAPGELLKYYDITADPHAPEHLQKLGLQEATQRLTKMYDIFDVWFESGSSWHAVMRARDLGYPIDLYLEGSDQHRGWFQASLLPGLGVTSRSPFTSVLTHGFVVDKDGYKMSKSGGNALDVDEVLKNFGADVCRWWVSSLAYENDVKGDLSFFEVAGESYRKVRNTLRFLLSNLYDFEPSSNDNPNGVCVDCASLSPTSIDAYILSRTADLQRQVLDAYESYDFKRAHQLLYDFCNEALSAFYCAAVKDRMYCDKPDSNRRRTAQTVMWDMLEVLCRLLAPILPHTADEACRALWKDDDSRCVHTLQAMSLPAVNVDANWSKVMQAREASLKALEDAKARGIENALDAEVVLPDPEGILAQFAADLPDMLGVSRVSFVSSGDVTVNDLRDEPRCERSWKRDGTVKERDGGVWLSDRDAAAIAST